jgi:molybdopterin-containing oxidoreductase family iron-sulfur binding subunit
MHVRCREGRAIKPEGNPDHPVSRGGLCPRGQSAPQGLYDPDRVRTPLRRSSDGERLRDSSRRTSGNSRNQPRNRVPLHAPLAWPQAIAEVTEVLKNAKRLFIVSDLQTGTLAELMRQFHRAVGIPGDVVFYEAFSYEALREANRRLFGRAVIPRYRLHDCDFILSFGADFLESWVSNVEFAWQFAQMHHRPEAGRKLEIRNSKFEIPGEAGQMVYVGPRFSMTAANADHFLQVPAGQEVRAAMAILLEVARLRGSSIRDLGFEISDSQSSAGPNPQSAVRNPQFAEVARRFVQAKSSVALGGPTAATGPAAERLALAAMALNQAAGRVGQTVNFSQVHALGNTLPRAQLEGLFAGLGPGDVLIVHQANLAYSLPSLRNHLERVENIIFLGTMLNETAELARWVLPVHSPLEAWGDYEPWTGIRCLMQPTMGPLHDTRHSGDVFLALAQSLGRPLQEGGEPPASFYDRLRRHWRQRHEETARGADFEAFWRQALQHGGVFEEERSMGVPPMTTGGTPVIPVGKMPMPREAAARARPIGPISPMGPVEEASPEALQLWLWPSIKLFDGRLSNRGWLQEVPERMSTLAWGSWVDLAPATAQRLGIREGDAVEISTGAGQVTAPARITDDVADNVVALAFGQGHTELGETARGRGVNAFALWTRPERDSLFGAVELRKTGQRMPLIYLSATQQQHAREILQWTTPQRLRSLAKDDVEEIIWPGPRGYDPHRDLYAPHSYKEHRWAMAVDLDRCIGCGACTVACYAENNIPVMGPGPVAQGREMAWLSVPPYRDPEEPRRVGFLPLPCQHCDAAPCEPVCPVFAAVHNEQGLNVQVYGRCIGTRYCSNNCPYKVRRFGWFDPHWREPLHMQLNPDVTVRSRGVMEKCTFCVQRIHHHQRLAKVEGRPLRDGEIQPACVQSCPTRTFVFGDLMDPDSEVSRLFEHPRRYQLLKELNTKPAVVYLKRIKPDKEEWKSGMME